MRLAVAYEDGQVFQHFGHTAQFMLLDAEDGRYMTYVYCWDGSLRELFLEAGEEFEPEYGEIICPAQAFHPELEGQRLTMRLTDGMGRERTLTAALVCAAGEEALP